MTRLLLPPLYPILDSSALPASGRNRFLATLAAELLAAGVTLLQYRNKHCSDDEILADASVLRTALSSDRCLLILNDRPDLVEATGFDGVHIGQEDLHPEEARAIIGADSLLGVSTHNATQLSLADQTSADYLAIGPVFSTTSKLNPDPVIGLEGVRLARSLTHKPLVAIGGITVSNCRAVRHAGADSVAVISAIFAGVSGASPGKLAKDFFAEFR